MVQPQGFVVLMALAAGLVQPTGGAIPQPDNAVIERAARQYRMQLYHTFRLRRAEYDRRREAWDQVVRAWEAAGRRADQRHLLLEWLQAALRSATPETLGPVPDIPDFGQTTHPVKEPPAAPIPAHTPQPEPRAQADVVPEYNLRPDVLRGLSTGETPFCLSRPDTPWLPHRRPPPGLPVMSEPAGPRVSGARGAPGPLRSALVIGLPAVEKENVSPSVRAPLPDRGPADPLDRQTLTSVGAPATASLQAPEPSELSASGFRPMHPTLPRRAAVAGSPTASKPPLTASSLARIRSPLAPTILPLDRLDKPASRDLPPPTERAQINQIELAAQILGTNLALRACEAELDKQETWSVQRLTPLVERLRRVMLQRHDCRLLYDLLPEAEQALVGAFESPRPAMQALARRIAEARQRAQGAEFAGTEQERQAELRKLDELARNLDALASPAF